MNGLKRAVLLFYAFGLAAWALSAGQTKANTSGGKEEATLAGYLGAKPWNPESLGPLFVLEPERARLPSAKRIPYSPIEAEKARLAQLAKPITNDIWGKYGRKKVKVGNLSVLVDQTMTIIDDSSTETPDLFSGLLPGEKVTYLLGLLTQSQLKKISTTGISLSDLSGEAKLVYSSILPKIFGFYVNRVGPQGDVDKLTNKGVLSDRERNQVRLKVERMVEFQVYLKEGGFSFYGSDRYLGEPDTDSISRDTSVDFEEDSTFGLRIRKEVLNTLKKSELPTQDSQFNRVIPIDETTTVGAVLSKINRTCKVEIIPDFRVAKRKVRFFGTSASASELLRALAWSLQATYRRVGPAYVLTSDLVGLGVRKTRIAHWEESLRVLAQEKLQKVRESLTNSGSLKNFNFDEQSGLLPNDRMKKAMTAQFGSADQKVDLDDLPPSVRSFVLTWDSQYKQQKMDRSAVGVSGGYGYRFILPNGKPLACEGMIGQDLLFAPRSSGLPPDSGTRKFPVLLPPDKQLSFCYSAQTIESVQTIFDAISAFPGSKLWLETRSESVFKAAIQAGKQSKIEVGLAIRPFSTASAPFDEKLVEWAGQELLDAVMRTSMAPYLFPEFTHVLAPHVTKKMSPLDPRFDEEIKVLQNLAKMSGSAGTLILDTQPRGYEPKDSPSYSTLDPLQRALVKSGFALENRVRFLRSEGIDPIDMGDSSFSTKVDLRQKYFFDDGLRGMPSLYDGRDDTNEKTRSIGASWRKFLWAANENAVQRLFKALDRPALIEGRPESAFAEERMKFTRVIMETLPGQALPVFTESPDSVSPTGLKLLRIFLPEAVPAGTRQHSVDFLQLIGQKGRPSSPGLLIDLSLIPERKLKAALGLFLKPANP